MNNKGSPGEAGEKRDLRSHILLAAAAVDKPASPENTTEEITKAELEPVCIDEV